MKWSAAVYMVLAVVFVTRVIDAWTRGSLTLAFVFAGCVLATLLLAVRELRKRGKPSTGGRHDTGNSAPD